MKNQFIMLTTLLLAATLISGCSGSGSTASTNTLAASIVGKVADGYLSGATVFLDKNNNYQLDAGEPSTTTDSTGSFTLTIDPVDVGKYPIVALAIKDTTVDLDTNTPVTSTYVLSMHGVSVTSANTGTITGTVSNFISPISTQLREMIESGKYSTVQAAEEALRTQMGLPLSANMTGDYIKNSDGAMHMAAQNIAAVMGSHMTQVMPGGKIDIAGYHGMIGSIFQNISAVKKGNCPNNTIFHDISSARVKPILHPFSSMFRPKGGGMMGGR